MSEQLTALFEQLRGSQPPTPFASPEQIRRRGRQRNHRQALAAGSAVLAVAGLGTGWAVGAAGQPSPRPPVPPVPSASSGSLSPSVPPTPSSPPTPSTPPTSVPRTVDPPSVSAARLLKPEEFAAVSGASASELEDQGGEWPWLTVVGGCPEYRSDDYPTVRERHDGRGLAYSTGAWQAWEIVESYPDAAANMADIRKAIATCPRYQYPDGVEIEQTVVAERFAGDDSLLVRVRRGEDADYMVVVRVGPLVATLMYADGPEADARAMAAAMEAHLR